MEKDEAMPGEEALEFETDLEAPPEKVWRALTVPELREHWLPGKHLEDPEPLNVAPGESVTYRMKEDESPHLESAVTFQVRSNGEGGTHLRVVHELSDGTVAMPQAANDDAPTMRLAA